MQIKTIQNVINTKLTEWLESITDEDLRKRLKSKILVSGGSITSMLLGEDVNDYDIYIKDMDILTELAEYYVRDYSSIQVLNGKERKAIIAELERRHGGVNINKLDSIFATSIRNLKEDQVKLIFKESTAGLAVNIAMREEDLNYTPLFFSPNAISLSNKLQIVTRFSGDNEKVHKTFDFMHATNYFTFKDGLVTNKEALESILTKQLKYQGSLYPLTTIIRMKKFIKRGWNINAGEILKVMFQISDLDLTDPDVLEDQLIGVDVAYFGKLIEILRGAERKDGVITSEYINKIIDRVFSQADPQDDITN